jgi:hypothetical protein
VGLVVAWFREKLGGALALAFLLAFYIWHLLRAGKLPAGPGFFLIAAPGLLFLLAGWMGRWRTLAAN